jgi:hypothetical protein
MRRSWVASVQLPHGGRYGGSFWVDTPGRSALLLSLEGRWLKCAVLLGGEGLIEGGMSGSPIISADGKAMGLISRMSFVRF